MIILHINGERRDVYALADMSLPWVLRDILVAEHCEVMQEEVPAGQTASGNAKFTPSKSQWDAA